MLLLALALNPTHSTGVEMAVAEVSLAIIRTTRAGPDTALVLPKKCLGVPTSSMGADECLRHQSITING